MWSVYKHTSPNGKVYIGMTKQVPEDRWQRGLGYRTQQRFFRAIKKYGWDSFMHEVLFSDLEFEEAERKERELISLYKSYDKNFGYNIERGGNCKKEVSQETIEKSRRSRNTKEYKERMRAINAKRWSDPKAHEEMSKRFSGKNNPMYGRVIGEEERERRRQKMLGRPAYKIMRGEENPMYGKHLTAEMKAKISEANSGVNNGRARKVICIETGIIYGCMTDASRENNICVDSISSCCRGITHTAGGFHWRYSD